MLAYLLIIIFAIFNHRNLRIIFCVQVIQVSFRFFHNNWRKEQYGDQVWDCHQGVQDIGDVHTTSRATTGAITATAIYNTR